MKIDNNELVDFCKKKWNVTDSNDPQIRKFEQNIDNFMKLFNVDDAMLIKRLIKQFMYYDVLMVRDQMINMYEQLKIEKGFDENNTIFVAIEKDGIVNSSVGYIYEFILSNHKVNKYMYRQGGLNAYNEEELSVINNIVILDDICGSGRSFDTFLKKYCFKLKDKNVYYIVIHIMEEAREHLDEMKYNSINISYKSYNQTSKAFKNNNKERSEFEIISKSLGYKLNEIYGFKD